MDPKLRSKHCNTNTDLDPDPELSPPTNCSDMVIKTVDGSSYKKIIISASATYICHTCGKVKKNGVHIRKWNWPIIVSRNTLTTLIWIWIWS